LMTYLHKLTLLALQMLIH